MARRLLPALLVIPLVIGWLRLYGERTAKKKRGQGKLLTLRKGKDFDDIPYLLGPRMVGVQFKAFL